MSHFTDSGEPGDTVQFAEYVERNLRLYQIRSVLDLTGLISSLALTTPLLLIGPMAVFDSISNHLPLRPSSAASWTRNTLAQSLRSRKPYSVNLLLGGYDPTSSTPELYWIDYLGTLGVVPYAAHGYGAYFALSTMDRWHSPENNLEQGLELLRKCIDELEKRFIVNLGTFTIRGTNTLTDRGCSDYELISDFPPRAAQWPIRTEYV